MILLFFIFLLFSFSNISVSQSAYYSVDDVKLVGEKELTPNDIIVNKIISLGFNTDGWGGSFDYMRGSEKTKHVIGFEFKVRKHVKEKLYMGIDYQNGYYDLVYGKKNICYPLSLYYGKNYLIGSANQVNGLSIDLTMKSGVSMALMRPYYLNVYIDEGNNRVIKDIKYSEEDSVVFFSLDHINGSSYFKGWGEIDPILGFNLGVLLNLEFASNPSLAYTSTHFMGIRVAANLEWYFKKLEIMVGKPNIISNNFFIYGSMAFCFGFKKIRSR